MRSRLPLLSNFEMALEEEPSAVLLGPILALCWERAKRNNNRVLEWGQRQQRHTRLFFLHGGDFQLTSIVFILS